MAAFDAAVLSPIDGMETDVQPAADGTPMLFHDRTLGQLGAPRRRVTGMTPQQLRTLDAGGWFDKKFVGERLPTLDELLDRHGQKKVRLMLEIKLRGGRPSTAKHLEVARKTARAVLDRGLEARGFILSFGLDLLLACHAEFPALKYVWNLKQPADMTMDMAARIRPLFALCCRRGALDKRWVDWVHGQGRAVWTYTVNNEAAADWALAMGVDGMMSDRPEWLCGYMAECFKGL